MKIMSTTFENAQRVAVSLIGALFATAIMVSAAASVIPVA